MYKEEKLHINEKRNRRIQRKRKIASTCSKSSDVR